MALKAVFNMQTCLALDLSLYEELVLQPWLCIEGYFSMLGQ